MAGRLSAALDRRRKRDERGAVAVFTAIVMVLLLLVGALAIDLGMQRVVRRDMQAVADLVAFDLARQLDGRDASTITSSSSWRAALRDSLTRNDDNLGRSLQVCETVDQDEPCVVAELGTIDSRTYAFDPLDARSTSVPTGVRVTARSSVDFAFSGLTGTDTGSGVRSAVAGSQVTGCFKLGSWLARAGTDGTINAGAGASVGLLASQIDAALGLGVVSGARTGATALGYGGLADATVSVNDLLEVPRLNAGSVEQLLDTDLTVADFLAASADALRTNGDTLRAQVLTDLVRYSTTTTLSQRMRLGQLISASTDSGAALDAGLNVLDLVSASILLATGENLAAVPVGLSIPGASSLMLKTALVEPPRIGCGKIGDAAASTAQATVTLTGSLTPPAGLLAAPQSIEGLTVSAPEPFSLETRVARADGRLTGATCLKSAVPGSRDAMDVEVDTASATTTARFPLRLSFDVTVAPRIPAVPAVPAIPGVPAVRNLLGIIVTPAIPGVPEVPGIPAVPPVVVTVTADVVVSARSVNRSDPAEVSLELPPNDTIPVSTGRGLGLAGASLSVERGAVSASVKSGSRNGIDLSFDSRLVTDAINLVTPAALSGVLGTLDSFLSQDVAGLIGINVAGADVFGIPKPDCSSPVLRG